MWGQPGGVYGIRGQRVPTSLVGGAALQRPRAALLAAGCAPSQNFEYTLRISDSTWAAALASPTCSELGWPHPFRSLRAFSSSCFTTFADYRYRRKYEQEVSFTSAT